ncbi:MAG: hypothetical protein M1831_004600 [Alyxoria varia]|nr:MAG: hypothetical protein M1831_004600 [Alyxoria varia]
MPSLPVLLANRAGVLVDSAKADALFAEPETSPAEPDLEMSSPTLVRRVNIPFNSSTAPPGLVEAETVDPFSDSEKYALGWIYFSIILLAFAIAARLYNLWTDKVRTASHKDRIMLGNSPVITSPETPYEMSNLYTDRSTNKLFPRDVNPEQLNPAVDKEQSAISSVSPVNNLITAFRYVFYRPTPSIRLNKKTRPITFPSLAVLVISFAALAFTVLYCFIPQPLYWSSIRFGSPPLAIRSGMLAVAMMPWLVALSMKANLVSLLTGIGHERLNALHRWGGWLCLFLSLVHTIPFYITPVWDKGGYAVFRSFFNEGVYVYGTAAIVFLAMMFWHCNNYLTSWNYLWATMAIWMTSYLARLFFLNWTNPLRLSWLIGDEAAVYLMPENAIKITIPTQVKWKPGQYVYLRMPGISVFENHPFTIASLCSDDFPSEYGEEYRDMVLVFRPFGGFTKKVLDTALEKGPWHSYRAFIDGPYGGVHRSLEAFDTIILIAGGSGITALISHLLDLIKRMRDGKAVTKKIHIIWALKRPDTMEWFKEELQICREFAPPDTVECQFYITAAKREGPNGQLVSASTPGRVIANHFHDKVNDAFQDIASKRHSHFSEISQGRHSALIQDEAAGDAEKEAQLRQENEDRITSLPRAQVIPKGGQHSSPNLSSPTPSRSADEKRRSRNLQLDVQAAAQAQPGAVEVPQEQDSFNFGFPSTPTEFQKNLMRFAFLPTGKKRDGWSVEYGRPPIHYMLKQLSKEFRRRTCVFVCGPPSMRRDVCRTVADLQAGLLKDSSREELFLHTENYSI